MQYETISDARQLERCCETLAQEPVIAFDTEFVSEDTYRPELCLVQVAAGKHLYVIDPQPIRDLTPFWETLAAPGHTTVVHAGREELRFSLRAIGRLPYGLIDVQIAAGLVGIEYPAAYSTLVSRLLHISLAKGETRTDWRRRPLSARQIEYALQDVVHLDRIREILEQRLDELGRRSWLDEEMAAFQEHVQRAESVENWRRVSGVSGLPPRSLAIVRELWRWRDEEAERRNMPPRRILRDDLIVELAKRQSSDIKHIHAVRGLERRGLQRHMEALSNRIAAALQLTEEEWPSRPAGSTRPQLNLIGQFLATALGSICRDAQVAPSLVGTAQDVRDLVAFRLNLERPSKPPVLTTGWRAQVVGHVIDELLEGKLAIVVSDPLAEQPLGFVPVESCRSSA